MKKLACLALILMIALSASSVLGEQWYRTAEVTVGWDAVTTLTDGTPVPATDTITYNVYVRQRNAVDALKVMESDQPLAALTFSQEGFWRIGIQAVRHIPENGELFVSTISWSDMPEVCFNGETFGVRFHLPPGQVKDLEKKP